MLACSYMGLSGRPYDNGGAALRCPGGVLAPPADTVTSGTARTALHSTALHCNEPHSTRLNHTALYCTALHCSVPHCIAPICTARQRIVQYCLVLSSIALF